MTLGNYKAIVFKIVDTWYQSMYVLCFLFMAMWTSTLLVLLVERLLHCGSAYTSPPPQNLICKIMIVSIFL